MAAHQTRWGSWRYTWSRLRKHIVGFVLADCFMSISHTAVMFLLPESSRKRLRAASTRSCVVLEDHICCIGQWHAWNMSMRSSLLWLIALRQYCRAVSPCPIWSSGTALGLTFERPPPGACSRPWRKQLASLGAFCMWSVSYCIPVPPTICLLGAPCHQRMWVLYRSGFLNEIHMSCCHYVEIGVEMSLVILGGQSKECSRVDYSFCLFHYQRIHLTILMWRCPEWFLRSFTDKNCPSPTLTASFTRSEILLVCSI